jgi:hypothetical protein
MATNTGKRFKCPSHWTIAQRLDAFTDKSGGPDACWPWMRSRTKDGYGTLGIGGKVRRTHVLAWVEKHGPIPPGLQVLHKCDNPPCRNENHLFLGTNDDNMADKTRKGRNNTPKGAAHYAARLTPDQVRAIRVDKRMLKEIAADYGVGLSIISGIRTGKKWASVT